MTATRHIVIACSYLHVPGGYEKAMITTASLFAAKGNKVTLLIIDHTAATYYPLHPQVQVLQRNMNFGITQRGNTISRKIKMWRETKQFAKIIRQLKPDFLICAEYPIAIAAILGGVSKYTKVFSWEHHHFHAQQLNRFWQYLFKKTYSKLDAVVCLNKDEQVYYLPFNKNAVVIPNFIESPHEAHPVKKEYQLLSVTRFNHIKGIDLLMQTAKLVLPQHTDWKWKVIGYGEQKEEFLSFIKLEKLTAQLIYQPADKTDINKEYQSASIHVMTSRNECFPLVLLEAMSNGLPCIAFDCDTGPRHIIQQDSTGLLVPKEDVQAMAAAISSLVDDKRRIASMSQQALNAVQTFYPEQVYKLWETLFSEGAQSSQSRH